MLQIPVYINAVFIITALLTLWFLYRAGGRSVRLLLCIFLWLALQSVLSFRGFYTITAVPPRFALALIPALILILILFISRKGRASMDKLDTGMLTLLHVVRIPVELCLYWLFLYKAVPQIMTFEGHNFDILCGITAPVIYYFGYVRRTLNKSIILAWNLLCLVLLAHIVITAVLSAPLPFQQLAFDQPNIALFYFPFIWLPCFVVPLVLLAHLVSIRALIRGRQ